MRLSAVLAGLLAASCAGTGERNEVSAARETIRDASTLGITFTCEVAGGKMGVRQNGTLTLASPNRFRLEMRTPADPRGGSVVVCDGDRVSYDLAGQKGELAAPSNLGALLREVAALEPLQLFFVVFTRPSRISEAVSDELSRLRESRAVFLGNQERTGRAAKKFEVKSGKGVISASTRFVWMVPGTDRLLQKSMAFEGHGIKFLISEEWESLKIDEEVDPSLFQLPK